MRPFFASRRDPTSCRRASLIGVLAVVLLGTSACGGDGMPEPGQMPTSAACDPPSSGPIPVPVPVVGPPIVSPPQDALIAPRITSGPTSVQLTAGDSASFAVEATGSGPLTYQWSHGATPIAGATSAILLIAAASAADAGTYAVLVNGPGGQALSDTVTLTVAPAPVAPSITTAPQSQTVMIGANATLSVAADGTAPLSYQWQHDGIALAGETGPTLSLASVTVADAGSYRVTVRNAAGQVLSTAATLSLVAVPAPPAITTQPADLRVNPGAAAMLAVAATGSAPLGYQWQRNGVDLAGATSSVLTIGPVAFADDGSRYTVRVRNAAGEIRSRAVALAVRTTLRLTAGLYYSVALLANGQVMAWGNNTDGQLGHGAGAQAQGDVPGTVVDGNGAPLTGIVDVSAALGHVLALREDGVVFAWGFNGFGQLGDGTSNDRSVALPVLDANAQPLTGIVAVSAGTAASYALKADGTLLAWGRNNEGQLGDGSFVSRPAPAPVLDAQGVPTHRIVAVRAGHINAIALQDDGSVLQWGEDILGSDSATPQAVLDGSGAPLTGITAIGNAYLHSLAVRSDGSVVAWGNNIFGQLGDGTTTSRATAAPVLDVNALPLGGIVAVRCSFAHSMALTASGQLFAWGNGYSGQLGNGSLGYSTAPVQVQFADGTPLTGVTAMAAGAAHSLALTADGRLLAWGDDTDGELGNGPGDSPSSHPDDVLAPANTFAAASRIRKGGL